jgi:hypothetical protein
MKRNRNCGIAKDFGTMKLVLHVPVFRVASGVLFSGLAADLTTGLSPALFITVVELYNGATIDDANEAAFAEAIAANTVVTIRRILKVFISFPFKLFVYYFASLRPTKSFLRYQPFTWF